MRRWKQRMPEPPPDALRCDRNDGKGWRCSKAKMDDARYCEHHYGKPYLRGERRRGGAAARRRSKSFSARNWSDEEEETGSEEEETRSEDDDEDCDKSFTNHHTDPTCHSATGVKRHRTSPSTHPEAQETQRLHFDLSAPPPGFTQLPESQPGPQVVTHIIPESAAAGIFCVPRDVDIEKVDIDGLVSTGTFFMSKAMTLFEIGAKRLRETQKLTSSTDVLKEENLQLKTEVEALKKQCSELKTKTEFDASEVRWLEGQLMTRVKVERELAETRTEASDWRAEKDMLSLLLEQSRDEIAAKSLVIIELELSIETLRASAIANAKAARLAGYDDGLVDGRRMGWREFLEQQQREQSGPQRAIQSCAATLAGSSSPAL